MAMFGKYAYLYSCQELRLDNRYSSHFYTVQKL